MNVSFAPLSPTVDMVFVMVGYLYILDLPGLSNSSNINYRGEKNKTKHIINENEREGWEKNENEKEVRRRKKEEEKLTKR